MHPTVLVVEEERTARQVLVRHLEQEALPVEGVGSPDEALERLEDRNVDVVVLDARMPGRKRRDLLDELRARGYTGAVLVLTPRATVEEAVSMMRRGVLDYLERPVDLDHLVERLLAVFREQGTPGAAAGGQTPPAEHVRIPVGTPLREAERTLILRTLETCGYNKSRAARMLGISARKISYKLEEWKET